MDLSNVPELELRRKIKPINDRLDAIEAELQRAYGAEHEKTKAAYAPLLAERERLEAQINELLGEDRCIEGTCCVTGLPIFSDDGWTDAMVLTCVTDAKKAAA